MVCRIDFGKMQIKGTTKVNRLTRVLTVSIIYTLFSSSNLSAQKFHANNETSEISNSILDWTFEIEGDLRDFIIGGDYLLVLSEKFAEISIVTYMDLNGKVLWEKRYNAKYNQRGDHYNLVRSISLSRDGKSIIVNYFSERWMLPTDRVNVSSFSQTGELKWEKEVTEPGMKLSPSGKYAITTGRSGAEGIGYFIAVDNNTGTELWKRDITLAIWKADFIDNERVVYFESAKWQEDAYMYIINLEKKEITKSVKISDNFDTENPFYISIYNGSLKISADGKMIALAGYNYDLSVKKVQPKPRTLVLFNDNADVLWVKNDFKILTEEIGRINDYGFSADFKYIIVGSGKNTFDMLNSKTGEREWRTISEVGSNNTIDNVIIEKDKVFIVSGLGRKPKLLATFNLTNGSLEVESDANWTLIHKDEKLNILLSLDRAGKYLRMLNTK